MLFCEGDLMRLLLIAFGILVIYRFCFCLSGLLRVLYYEKKYDDFLRGRILDFFVYEAPVRKLFKQAEIQDSPIPLVELMGYGHVKQAKYSVLHNMGMMNEDVVGLMLHFFAEAKGFFKTGLLECISPLYWIQTLLFLPSRLCEYMGISDSQVFVKILQLGYWILTPILIAWRSELYKVIVALLDQAQ